VILPLIYACGRNTGVANPGFMPDLTTGLKIGLDTGIFQELRHHCRREPRVREKLRVFFEFWLESVAPGRAPTGSSRVCTSSPQNRCIKGMTHEADEPDFALDLTKADTLTASDFERLTFLLGRQTRPQLVTRRVRSQRGSRAREQVINPPRWGIDLATHLMSSVRPLCAA
jgi:hypothetical protein